MTINANDYQQLAARTLIAEPGFDIPGEAGEVAEHIKKGVFHQHGIDRDKLLKELGDVAWYLAALCTVLHADLGDVMQANIDKLRTRYPNGYASADSVRRVDV